MKFCSYTNFDALFPSVVLDFPFLRLNEYFEIAKFVYSAVARHIFSLPGVDINSCRVKPKTHITLRHNKNHNDKQFFHHSASLKKILLVGQGGDGLESCKNGFGRCQKTTKDGKIIDFTTCKSSV